MSDPDDGTLVTRQVLELAKRKKFAPFRVESRTSFGGVQPQIPGQFQRITQKRSAAMRREKQKEREMRPDDVFDDATRVPFAGDTRLAEAVMDRIKVHMDQETKEDEEITRAEEDPRKNERSAPLFGMLETASKKLHDKSPTETKDTVNELDGGADTGSDASETLSRDKSASTSAAATLFGICEKPYDPWESVERKKHTKGEGSSRIPIAPTGKDSSPPPSSPKVVLPDPTPSEAKSVKESAFPVRGILDLLSVTTTTPDLKGDGGGDTEGSPSAHRRVDGKEKERDEGNTKALAPTADSKEDSENPLRSRKSERIRAAQERMTKNMERVGFGEIESIQRSQRDKRKKMLEEEGMAAYRVGRTTEYVPQEVRTVRLLEGRGQTVAKDELDAVIPENHQTGFVAQTMVVLPLITFVVINEDDLLRPGMSESDVLGMVVRRLLRDEVFSSRRDLEWNVIAEWVSYEGGSILLTAFADGELAVCGGSSLVDDTNLEEESTTAHAISAAHVVQPMLESVVRRDRVIKDIAGLTAMVGKRDGGMLHFSMEDVRTMYQEEVVDAIRALRSGSHGYKEQAMVPFSVWVDGGVVHARTLQSSGSTGLCTRMIPSERIARRVNHMGVLLVHGSRKNMSIMSSMDNCVTCRAERVSVHAGYDILGENMLHMDSLPFGHDLALIRLSRRTTLRYGRTAVLDSGLFDPMEEEARLEVAGWGDTDPFESNAEYAAYIVRETLAVRNKRCLQPDSYGPRNFSHACQICAQGGPLGVYERGVLQYADSCQADSGGPLFVHAVVRNRRVPYHIRPLLVGIVSWGRGCNEEMYPGIYTRIGAYIQELACVTCADSTSACAVLMPPLSNEMRHETERLQQAKRLKVEEERIAGERAMMEEQARLEEIRLEEEERVRRDQEHRRREAEIAERRIREKEKQLEREKDDMRRKEQKRAEAAAEEERSKRRLEVAEESMVRADANMDAAAAPTTPFAVFFSRTIVPIMAQTPRRVRA